MIIMMINKMQKLRQRMVRNNCIDLTFTMINAREKWINEKLKLQGDGLTFGKLLFLVHRDDEMLSRYHDLMNEYRSLSSDEIVSILDSTEIAESDLEKGRESDVEIRDGKLVMYRTTNESVEGLKRRIDNLDDEIRGRRIDFNTQLGIGIYFFLSKESVFLSRWMEQKGAKENVIRATIDIDDVAFQIDLMRHESRFETWLAQNGERIAKKEVEGGCGSYLRSYAFELYLKEQTGFKAYVADVDNLIFFGANKDIEIRSGET